MISVVMVRVRITVRNRVSIFSRLNSCIVKGNVREAKCSTYTVRACMETVFGIYLNVQSFIRSELCVSNFTAVKYSSDKTGEIH